MRLIALCFALGLTLGGAHALSASDMRRAAQQVPRDAFRGLGRADTNRVLSRALRRAAAEASGATKPCEEFSVEALIDVKRVLFAARDPELERVYAQAGDARRLATFGSEADSLPQLERLWAQELALLADAPHLRDAARDAKCYEAAMWFTHHVPAAARPEVAHAVALPELPRAHGTGSVAPPKSTEHRASERGDSRVHASLKGAMQGCRSAHFLPGTGDLTNSSTVPNWPTTFSADITQCITINKTGTLPPLPHDCGSWSPCDNPRGKMWYDWSNPQLPLWRMDLENCACHQFMGNAAPGHDIIPKNQYTGPGTVLQAPTSDGASAKYVFWPELHKCCQCTSEKHGAGVVRPDVMVRGNAEAMRAGTWRAAAVWCLLLAVAVAARGPRHVVVILAGEPPEHGCCSAAACRFQEHRDAVPAGTTSQLAAEVCPGWSPYLPAGQRVMAAAPVTQ